MSSSSEGIAVARSKGELGPFPLDRRAYTQLGLAYALLVAIGLALGWLLLNPMAGTAIETFDSELALTFESVRTPVLDRLTDIGSGFAGTYNVIAAIIVLILAMAWLWKRWRESLVLGLALALEALVFLTVSLVVGRERPPVEQLDMSPPTASFPSGHTGAAFALYFTLALIVFWNTENLVARTAAVIGAIVIPISVAISRLYRGMHYLTDVLVGAGLGAACVFIVVRIVTEAIERKRAETGP
ncbi:MAG: PAP2 family protein [Actinobacteria bacterium]|nr:MAG: PAP2 family protein [Actinomycetota bacterium]REK34433.1 MAG: PAP2 family protein [Actinomycetota bacterium]